MARILKANDESIKEAARIIKKGGLVVTQTDTLYALSASALNKRSIKRVYEAKGRDYSKPLSIMFYSLSQAKKYVKCNSLALKLAKKFLPGPLTIILPMKRKFPKELTGSNKVGIRIPDNKIALELIKLSKVPITATSANISNGKNPTTVEDAIKQVGNKIDLILDGDECKFKKPSTVIEVQNHEIKILRKGVIPKSSLKEIK